MDQKNQEKNNSNIIEETRRLRMEVRKQLTTYITAALGLVAGLAWNDAIHAFIDHFIHTDKNSLFAKFAYAIIVTVAVVIVSMYVLRVPERKDS